ncbi:MAG: ABC transporter permease, partial [Clostridium sp.]
TIKESEYILLNDTNSIDCILNDFIKNNEPIIINGKKVMPAQKNVLSVNINNESVKNNLAIIAVNDDIVYGVNNSTSFTNIMFKDGMEDKLNSAISLLSKDIKSNINYVTKEQVLAESFELGAQLSYISIYLGVIFLVTSAAILAIQQLSECDNNIERYRVIKKIGVDEKMINKSLFFQIAIYFMIPLSLACIHSIAGLTICSKIIILLSGGTGITSHILFTAGMCLVIYGGYFWATYLETKGIIKKYI